MSRARSVRLLASTLTLVVAASIGSTAQAQQPSKGEQAVKYRKALYQVIVWNFGPMNAMATDKAPFEASEYAKRAARVADLTPMLADAYPAESQSVKETKLKAEAWTNRADFDKRLQDLVDRSAALAVVAKGGDVAKIKTAHFEVANTCKGCHDKYKAD
jgi:cytochrome c556